MDYMELARQILHNSYQFRKLKHFRKINMSMKGEIFVLLYLLEQGDNVLPSEISNEMNISTARIAALLNSLERKGLITRRIDESDRRRILVDLTASGKKLAKKHDNMVMEGAVQMLKLLSEEEALELARIIEKLAELMPENSLERR